MANLINLNLRRAKYNFSYFCLIYQNFSSNYEFLGHFLNGYFDYCMALVVKQFVWNFNKEAHFIVDQVLPLK